MVGYRASGVEPTEAWFFSVIPEAGNSA
jgi:hypothetical protein